MKKEVGSARCALQPDLENWCVSYAATGCQERVVETRDVATLVSGDCVSDGTDTLGRGISSQR